MAGCYQVVIGHLENREVKSEAGISDLTYLCVNMQQVIESCRSFALAICFYIEHIHACFKHIRVSEIDCSHVLRERDIEIGQIVTEKNATLGICFRDRTRRG